MLKNRGILQLIDSNFKDHQKSIHVTRFRINDFYENNVMYGRMFWQNVLIVE
jgi:hypothetical protein